ncbi:MAG: hypothetical protein M1823_004506 [Watsoniomyces obsoletus]|nr:MAG: hypothetical protein M1823_004506 [Watsoniomyces obsoletus]
MADATTPIVTGTLLQGHYRVLARLNSGAYGEVFLAVDLHNNERVAVKRLVKPGATIPSEAHAVAVDERSEEVLCHAVLGTHPSIVSLLDHFETDAHIFLVLEFCSNGDLFETIQLGQGPLKTEHVRAFMLQLVDAVDYMHAKGFYHRDIKPENIFLTEAGDVKLGDFGLVTREQWSHEVAVGSERYMAPEQYDPGESGYAPAPVDIWAVGICLLNVLFASNPFKVPRESDPLFADYLRDPQSLFDLFPKMTLDTFDVLVHALAIDPKRRSLAAVREALMRVVSFTSDDETYDEVSDHFCTETREIIPVRADREPLRTPSIRSPFNEPTGAFPWAKILHSTQPVSMARPLSIIDDLSDEGDTTIREISPPVEISRPESPTMFRRVDSGLGSSLVSVELRRADLATTRDAATTRAIPVPVPAASTTMAAPPSTFGNKPDSVSKSWYDIWDEEVEEIQRTSIDSAVSVAEKSEDVVIETEHVATQPIDVAIPKTKSTLSWWRGSAEKREGRSSNKGVEGMDDRDEYYHVEHPVRPVSSRHRPSPSPSRSDIMDRWAALGQRRRAFHVLPNVPVSSKANKSRDGLGSSVLGRALGPWSRKGQMKKVVDDTSDDLADLELVGGWHEFHLH